ncbi:MAG: hypothetical protein HS126_24415 [Anaerolineales bacterium]|nr:hypothetical protein [Anaerolineales bacterium]
MYSEAMYESPPPQDSVGYGLFGCAGGILAGLLGGGILLLVASLVMALNGVISPVTGSGAAPDLRLTVREEALNQFAQSTTETPVQLDLMPGNQVSMKADTSVSAFGMTVPVQITGLFGVQITPQSSLEVRLIQANVSGVDLPQDSLAASFNDPLAAINQNLNEMVKNSSTLLGVPLVLTGLGTTDTALWLEARTQP